MKAMAKHRTHSIEFKRQVALDFIAGETLHGLAKRHDVSRNLIRIWVKKLEAGAFDEDARAADLLQEYEAKIAALERMVGRQALEIEFLKGALKSVPRRWCGWGARIRTWEWRNQNLRDYVDRVTNFSRLRVAGRKSRQ
jgi:transposase